MRGDRDALLIATGSYESPTLRALRSPAQDVAELARVLEDPGLGGFRVQSVTDLPAHQVTRAVERFFRGRGRDDILLLQATAQAVRSPHARAAATAGDGDRPGSGRLACVSPGTSGRDVAEDDARGLWPVPLPRPSNAFCGAARYPLSRPGSD